MAAELPRPGVEVIQVFQTVTPTVITPTLVPCIVGVCKQEVDVLTTSATGASILNSVALTELQAVLLAAAATGSPPVYTGLTGLNLDLSLNNGPTVSIVFAGTPLSPAQVVATVLLAFSVAGITQFSAQTFGDTQWEIVSVAPNQYQSIEVLSTSSPTVLTAFGFAAGRVETGAAYYDQDITLIYTSSFPNPNNNLDELVIDPTTVRVFLYLGGSNGSSALLEALQTQSFLENGIGTAAVITGDVSLAGLTYATYATAPGTVALTTGSLYGSGGSLNGETIILTVNGVGPTTLTLSGTGNAANEAALLSAINTTFTGLTASAASGTNFLQLIDNILGSGGTIVVGAGTANTTLGLTATTYNGVNATLNGETLELALNGNPAVTITFVNPTSAASALAQINTVIDALTTASEATSTNYLVLTSNYLGPAYSIQITGGNALTTLGLATGAAVFGVAGVQAIASGNGSAVTNILQFLGANFAADPTSAQVTGTSSISSGVTAGQTLILDDGTGPQTLVFASPCSTSAEVLTQINALFGAAAGGRILATVNGSTFLVLTNTYLGVESLINVIGGTAISALGLTAAETTGYFYGSPFAPLPGDTITVDGLAYATITQVAPGGNVNQLLISSQVPVSNNVGIAWYITAMNLSIMNEDTGVTRPYPNLIVDGFGDAFLKQDLIRNTHGNPVYPSLAQIYIQYQALRLDVTAAAAQPALLSFTDTTDLTNQLSPITTDNPLGLGVYFALLNGPGISVTALGVDEYTGAEPFGTIDAFTRAATFLEGFEVYAIAILTHDPTVSQVFQTHVDLMSQPENMGERIVLINPETPTNFNNTLVASGTDGNTTQTTNQFDTGVHNLTALLLAQGLPPAGPYLVSDGIFLDDGDGNNYLIINVVGSVAYIQTSGFLPGQNDDGFYSTTPLPSPLISQAFSVFVRGKPLVLTSGLPDLPNIALTVQEIAQGYNDRRVWDVFPDQCSYTGSTGVQQLIDGFYLSAGIAGMIGAQPPQQSFTNFPMTGYTTVNGSQDTFSNPLLNTIAAGGVYIIVQDAPSTPLISRMALTTDMTSVETRTDSVTKIVDFCAKFLRTSLKNFIGRFNITQGFLDSLGHVIQGVLGFLAESGVLIGSNLNNIVQDTTEPDQVDVDVTLDVPLPCNYIRLTLVI
jgi:hypothetical protein